ncbi:MAG: NUDIX domain-containing protein, partial [Candidatus Eisenbacteria bacterium]|nr:NUDIX domain-containing protein [Candidatus Eisenbacteria bacterium]
MDAEYDIDAQVNWQDLHYCPRCGAELTEREVRGQVRPRCDDCGYVFYTPPAPVTCAVVVRDGRALLVRRRYLPKAGQWCLPAGFVEPGESPAESAAREVLEETGLAVEITGIVDSWASREDPRTPVV